MHSRQQRLLPHSLACRSFVKFHKTFVSGQASRRPTLSPQPMPPARFKQTSIQTFTTNQTRTMSTNNEPFLIRFFDPTTASPDSRGRTLTTILSWSDADLERSHDYIQTVFPLPEGSMFQDAQLITPNIRKAFLSQPELRAGLHTAFERMLSFYGLQVSHHQTEQEDGMMESVEEVTRGSNFDSNSRNWVIRFNHNHLRLTRILRSLRLLGLESDAAALHGFLENDEDVKSRVSPRSQMYWRRAAERPLHLSPDEDDDGAEGIEWLRRAEPRRWL